MFNRYIKHSSNLLKMDSALNHYSIHSFRKLNLSLANLISRGIMHGIGSCNKNRHITSCFGRQERINRPIILHPTCSADSFIHITRSAIVCSNHQMPVAIDIIQILKKTSCSMGRFMRIHAFIDQTIYFESVHPSGCNHKLP